MKVKTSKWLAVTIALLMILSFVPANAAIAEDCIDCGNKEVRLLAGQNMEVGTVTVTNDNDKLCVTYTLNDEALDEGWLIYETHLAIGFDLTEIPQTKPNKFGTNPIPGQFPYQQYFEEGVEEWTECIYFDELSIDMGDCLVIAAHAVVKKVDCETILEAPYGGSRVVDYKQGLRYNYTSVKSERSNANTVLTYTTGQNEANFFSLGFQEDREGYLNEDGWIIIEFYNPILNGAGNDLQVIEDTWGLPYPSEKAQVLVSQDGVEWIYLGEADNSTPYEKYHTITNFDLEDVDLDYARYVKVQDISERDDFTHLYPGQGTTLDGYDLNAVLALNDYKVCEEFDETAWGEGTRFNSQGNWGMYFWYKVCEGHNGGDECQNETAWGGVTEGAGNAWWYYYDTNGAEKQTIWAGQHMKAGIVTVSEPVNGEVTITITFNDGWTLQDRDESVKIQGYNGSVPDKRPAAGLFTTYKGEELVVKVDVFDYYAIHLDVQYCE